MILKTKRKKLRIPAELIDRNLQLKITGETEDTYQLASPSGLVVSIHKSIVEGNGLSKSGQTIVLTDSLYDNYIKKAIKKSDDAAAEHLRNGFGLVVTNPRRVLNDPAFFLIRSNWLVSGGSASGPLSYCLGALLEAWQDDKRFTVKNDQGNDAYLVMVGGSNLSGAIRARGWDPKNQRFVDLNRDHLPGGLPFWLQQFSTLSARYPMKLEANFRAVDELLKLCKEESADKPG